VLGSLRLDPNLCDDVALILGRRLLRRANQKLYAHCWRCTTRERIDVLLLDGNVLHRRAISRPLRRQLRTLAEVANSVPYAPMQVNYAEIVRDKANLGALIQQHRDSP